MPKKYKLTYFNARGLGEVARLMFALAKTEYEDERLLREEWQKVKSQSPSGQLPLLEVDGHKYFQSGAIYRFVAREFGFYGSNNHEATEIDSIVDSYKDVGQALFKVFFEKDEAKKAELAKSALEEQIPTWLGHIEKRLKANKDGKGFFVGDKVSLADVVSFNSLSNLRAWLGRNQPSYKAMPDRFTVLEEHRKRIENIPEIKAWLDKRPQTDS